MDVLAAHPDLAAAVRGALRRILDETEGKPFRRGRDPQRSGLPTEFGDRAHVR